MLGLGTAAVVDALGTQVQFSLAPVLLASGAETGVAVPELIPGGLCLDGKLWLGGELDAMFDCRLFNTDETEVTKLLRHPNAAIGLSDAGAHCGAICDGSFPTTLLALWWSDALLVALGLSPSDRHFLASFWAAFYFILANLFQLKQCLYRIFSK